MSVWGAQTNLGWMGLSEGSDLPADRVGLMAIGAGRLLGHQRGLRMETLPSAFQSHFF